MRKPTREERLGFHEFFHWFLYAFLVLCLVRLEPVSVVVSFQRPQEAEFRFGKVGKFGLFIPVLLTSVALLSKLAPTFV
jgi:hypothetical protein